MAGLGPMLMGGSLSLSSGYWEEREREENATHWCFPVQVRILFAPSLATVLQGTAAFTSRTAQITTLSIRVIQKPNGLNARRSIGLVDTFLWIPQLS